jgi:hypothetical protein
MPKDFRLSNCAMLRPAHRLLGRKSFAATAAISVDLFHQPGYVYKQQNEHCIAKGGER